MTVHFYENLVIMIAYLINAILKAGHAHFWFISLLQAICFSRLCAAHSLLMQFFVCVDTLFRTLRSVSEAVLRRCSVKNVFLKCSQNSPEETFVWVSGSLQLYWKRDSNTAVFLWILRNFYKYSFYRIPRVVASPDCA